MNYKFWRNSAIAAMVVGSLAMSGTALAANVDALSNAQGVARGHVRVGRIQQLTERIAKLQDQKSMLEAILKRDYATWKTLMEKLNPQAPSLKVVTADNFEKFAQLHEAMESGDVAKAQALRKELGLPEQGQGLGMGKGMGAGLGKGAGMGMGKGRGQGLHKGWAK